MDWRLSPRFLQMSIRGAARANCVGGSTTYLEAGLAAEAVGLGAEAAEAAANALAANMVASKTAITLVIFNFLELEFSRTFFMHEGPLITAQPGRGLTQSKIFSPVRSVDMRKTNLISLYSLIKYCPLFDTMSGPCSIRTGTIPLPRKCLHPGIQAHEQESLREDLRLPDERVRLGQDG